MVTLDFLIPTLLLTSLLIMALGWLSKIFMSVLSQVQVVHTQLVVLDTKTSTVHEQMDTLDGKTNEVHALMNSRFDQLKDEIVALKAEIVTLQDINVHLREKLAAADARSEASADASAGV